MIGEHDIVVLTQDLPEQQLKTGDVATIVHVHDEGAGYEAEFITLSGQTIAVATVMAPQVRPVSSRDVVHVRQLQLT